MPRYELPAILALICSCCIINAQEHTRFAWMTDIHYSVGSANADNLRNCVRDINKRDSIDFVLVSGDLTDFGTDAEIRDVKSILDSLTIPYHAIPGNHDAKWSESGSNTFAKVFGSEKFEFHAGGFRFLGCASGPDMRMTPALIPQADMTWLRGKANGEPTIFVNHFPLDSSVLNFCDIRTVLRGLDTRVVLGGHWHTNKVMDYDGLPGILSKSTQKDRKSSCGYNVVDIRDSVLRVIDIVPGNELSEPWHCIRLSKPQEPELNTVNGIAGDYPWTDYSINADYPSVREKWHLQENSGIASGFAVKGRRAWYVTSDGKLVCMNINNGKKIWERNMPGKAYSTPAVYCSMVMVGCASGGLYAYDAGNGRLLWLYMTDKSVLSSPAVLDGTVYFGDSGGHFRAVDAVDGRLVWDYPEVDGFVECKPWVDSEQVIFGTWGKKLYCLDRRDGKLQWVWNVGKASRMYSPAACNPVKSETTVFVAVPDRKVYRLSALNGEVLGTVEDGRECLCMSDDKTRVYVKTMYSKAYCIGLDGNKIWETRTALGYDISPTAPLFVGDKVLFPTDKGNIFCLSASDGSLSWGHKISLGLVNPISPLPDGSILVSTMDGHVARISF